MKLHLIFARSSNGVIGKAGTMPWHLPEDLAHFKRSTLGCPVIMGRKTFESILATLGKPLPGRSNIVITRNPAFRNPGITTVTTPEAALGAALTAPMAVEPPAPMVSGENHGEVFVIGGAEIYKAMLPLARRIIVTEIKQKFDGDAFFPALDPHVWRETARQPQPASGTPRVEFDFVEYRRQ